MLDTIALIQSLTLPAGALTGARIELDGVLGEIRVYDSSGNLRIRIANSGAGAVELFGGDSLEVVAGIIQELVAGAGGTRQLDLFLAPGIFMGGNRPTIDLLSDSQNGTIPGSIKYFSPKTHSFNPAGNGEMLLNGSRLPTLALTPDVNRHFDGGEDTIAVTTASTQVNKTITFNKDFSVAPLLYIQANDVLLRTIWRVSSKTIHDFVVNVATPDASTFPSNQTLTFDWLALGRD